MADTAKANLFTLPAELRNSVYRFVLLRPGRIDLSEKKSKTPPGLLTTCRQIRKETISIYYQENKFSFTVHDYHGVKAIGAFQLIKNHSPDDKDAIVLKLCPAPHVVDPWHLENWLERFHDSADTPSLRQDEIANERDDQIIARYMFGVVDSLRNKEWAKVQQVLESFFRAIDTFQEEDYDDEDEDYDEWASEDEDDETSDEDQDGDSTDNGADEASDR